ncbi:hypothetical protein UlMin_037029, partial [Ulmus minor]
MEEESSLRKANCRAKGASPGFKVAILGDTGGIGQPLAMLMKINPFRFFIYTTSLTPQVSPLILVIWILQL